MKRSKPSRVEGGGERKRDTSSVFSIASNDAASSIRSSRRFSIDPVSTGKPAFQFVPSAEAVLDAEFLVVVRVEMLTH